MPRPLKSRDTSVPVSRSQGELERILRRYGASAFSVTQNYDEGTATVAFRVPETPNSEIFIPVRLEVQIHRVVEKLKEHAGPRTTRSQADWFEQGERIAWRHLVLWVDAVLVAIETGLQTVSEAFLAQMLIEHNGRQVRVYDQFAESGGAKALIGKG